MFTIRIIIINSCKNMDRKEKIIRLLSQPAQGKRVKEEGIGYLSSDGYHVLGTTFFI